MTGTHVHETPGGGGARTGLNEVMSFRDLSRAEAESFVTAWTGTWPRRREWLEQEGGPDLAPVDLSRDFVVRLDAWGRPRVRPPAEGGATIGERPMWADLADNGDLHRYDPTSLWLVDAVALAVGESVLAGARGPSYGWAAGDHEGRRDAYYAQNWPVIRKGPEGPEFSPLWQCLVWASRILNDSPPRGGLTGQYDRGVDPQEM